MRPHESGQGKTEALLHLSLTVFDSFSLTLKTVLPHADKARRTVGTKKATSSPMPHALATAERGGKGRRELRAGATSRSLIFTYGVESAQIQALYAPFDSSARPNLSEKNATRVIQLNPVPDPPTHRPHDSGQGKTETLLHLSLSHCFGLFLFDFEDCPPLPLDLLL